MMVNPSNDTKGLSPGCRARRGTWAEYIRLLIALAVGLAASLTVVASSAAAGTTPACEYDRPDVVAHEALGIVLAPEMATDSAREPADRLYGGPVNVASARSGVEVVAPQTSLEQPCEGMLVYRVYGPGAGAGEYGRGWSPIDPRSIGSDEYRDVAGLPDDNPGTHLVIGELIDPSAVTEVRRALRCGPPYCNEKERPGGLTEFVIPTNRVAVVNRTYEVLSPAY